MKLKNSELWQTLYVNVYLRLFMPSNALVDRNNHIKSLHLQKLNKNIYFHYMYSNIHFPQDFQLLLATV